MREHCYKCGEYTEVIKQDSEYICIDCEREENENDFYENK